MGPSSPSPEQYVVKTVGALPLLRGFLKRVGLAEVLERSLPKDPQAYLSVGDVAEILVANRLSSPRPLYRIEEWAERAGVEQVFGFPPEWLNDDRLGRVLDRLGENAKALKGDLCLTWADRFGIELRRFHYDLTTVWLEGEYEQEEQPETIRIEYTKDSKWEPAGKGFRLGVSTFDDGRGAVSLAYQALDGTEATSQAAVKNVKELRMVLGQRVDRLLQVTDRAGIKPEVVARAAAEGIDVLGPLAMTLPLQRTIRDLLGKNPPWQPMSYLSDRQAHRPVQEQERYRAFEVPYSFLYEGKSYPARLIVVSSDGKRNRDEKSRRKHQQRIEQGLDELIRRAGQTRRGTKPDLRRNVQDLLARYREGKFYEVAWVGPPEAPTGLTWRVHEDRVASACALEGIYAAATTLLLESHPLDSVFTCLKQQWRVEDSHRILKGPLRISPVFLHHVKRIEGLVFLLWMALVVYQLLEREWRSKTPEPKTARWTTLVLLRLFEGYSYVGVRQGGIVRWVPCVIPSLHAVVYRTLGAPSPNSS